jgi:hypothetical protein
MEDLVGGAVGAFIAGNGTGSRTISGRGDHPFLTVHPNLEVES